MLVPFIYKAAFDKLTLLLKVTEPPFTDPMVLMERAFVAVFNKFVRLATSEEAPVAFVIIF